MFFYAEKFVLYNITALSLQCVFHGIRFKVNKEDCGCRETTILFFVRPVGGVTTTVQSETPVFHLITMHIA
jgi:hypothetical protein